MNMTPLLVFIFSIMLEILDEYFFKLSKSKKSLYWSCLGVNLTLPADFVLLNILSNADLDSHKFLTDVLGKYGITQKELAASMFADASYAGQRLNRLAQLSNNFRDATRRRTASEISDDELLAKSSAGASNVSRFKKLEGFDA